MWADPDRPHRPGPEIIRSASLTAFEGAQNARIWVALVFIVPVLMTTPQSGGYVRVQEHARASRAPACSGFAGFVWVRVSG